MLTKTLGLLLTTFLAATTTTLAQAVVGFEASSVLQFNPSVIRIDDSQRSSSFDVSVRDPRSCKSIRVFFESDKVTFANCTVVFNQNNFNVPQRVSVAAVPVYGSNLQQTTSNFKIYAKIYTEGCTIDQGVVSVDAVRNVVPGGYCHSWGDPHFRTWNGINYDFMGVGTYYLVRSPSITIQSTMFTCMESARADQRLTCNGVIAIRKNNGLLVVNSREVATNFPVLYMNEEMKQYVHVYATPMKNSYELRFNDGMRVSMTMNPFNGVYDLNVFIWAPAYLMKDFTGLCGTGQPQPSVNGLEWRVDVKDDVYRGCLENPRSCGCVDPRFAQQAAALGTNFCRFPASASDSGIAPPPAPQGFTLYSAGSLNRELCPYSSVPVIYTTPTPTARIDDEISTSIVYSTVTAIATPEEEVTTSYVYVTSVMTTSTPTPTPEIRSPTLIIIDDFEFSSSYHRKSGSVYRQVVEAPVTPSTPLLRQNTTTRRCILRRTGTRYVKQRYVPGNTTIFYNGTQYNVTGYNGNFLNLTSGNNTILYVPTLRSNRYSTLPRFNLSQKVNMTASTSGATKTLNFTNSFINTNRYNLTRERLYETYVRELCNRTLSEDPCREFVDVPRVMETCIYEALNTYDPFGVERAKRKWRVDCQTTLSSRRLLASTEEERNEVDWIMYTAGLGDNVCHEKCYGRGACLATGCECDPGYTGSFCNITYSMEKSPAFGANYAAYVKPLNVSGQPQTVIVPSSYNDRINAISSFQAPPQAIKSDAVAVKVGSVIAIVVVCVATLFIF